MKELIQLLIEKNLSISSIESLTAGLFASKLAEVPHASSVFKGSLVTYQTNVKIDVLGIPKAFLDEYKVISKECAEAMVIYGKRMFQSDFVVSCTGNAGPDVMDEKPVGQVYMAIYYQDKVTIYDYCFKGNRNEIREAVCVYLKERLLEVLEN